MMDNEVKRVVVKLGTRVLTLDDGQIANERLAALVDDVAHLVSTGREVLMVSSGAVGLGRDAIGLPPGPSDLATRQACAAIGQGRLMGLYETLFERHGLCCAQVLLTQSDFDDQKRYDNLRRTLATLLRHGVVPIINENDVVATEELAYIKPPMGRAATWGAKARTAVSFGDNDQLAALLAGKLEADLLVLLTDVDAVYDKNPNTHADASEIRTWTLSTHVDSEQDPGAGRGGMRSKIRSATHAARSGCTTVIASGRASHTLQRIFGDDKPGTWFPAMGRLSPEHQWISKAATAHGTIHLTSEAVPSLQRARTSLYADGVARISGSFDAGQVVEIRDHAENLIGRGAACCHSDVARAWANRTETPSPHDRVVLVRWDKLILETAP